jgi:DNA-binding transcriptional MerR regulator
MNSLEPSVDRHASPRVTQPTFRSGAAARMAGMPVATLRIWEQRYQAVQPSTAPSGHRLYSVTDVERVTFMRRLTQQGHAIGLLAALDIEQLRELLLAQSSTDIPASRQAPIRLVVVGQAMAQRLKRLAAGQSGLHAAQVLGYFDTLADAAQAARDWTGARVDLLLWQAASLQTGMADELRKAQDAWSARTVAVTYHFSSAPAREELLSAGAVVALEPADDASLAQWMASLQALATQANMESSQGPDSKGVDPLQPGAMDSQEWAVSPPRFADGALTDFAGLSSGIACECPGHLAGLIQQITHFENYSSGCANRSQSDAQMHIYLQRVAGAARMLFETALERVAVAEGLPLPSSPQPGISS